MTPTPTSLAAQDRAAEAGALPRPQPIGALPLPAGYLLIPADPELDTVRAELVAGRLPASWPAALEPLQLALAGETNAALAAVSGDAPIARINRFVLDGGPDAWADLADLEGELGAHVQLVAYSLGLTDDVPSDAGLDGEFAAMALTAQAAAATETGDLHAAVRASEAAVAAARPVSGALTAQLLGGLAEARVNAGAAPATVVTLFDEAVRLLQHTDLTVGRAELFLAKGLTLHAAGDGNPGALLGAVEAYQAALGLISADSAPELFAMCHANLASAYLTLPMTQASDQLRVGVAVQSLRHTLSVFTPESHPEQWASAQLNLANALVYMPSAKQGDNLVEAVELYEAVLATRDADTDPLGYARVAANQGNALAHLGIFGQAKGRLHEARFLFEEHGDLASVATVRSVLDEIAKETSAASRNTTTNHALPPRPGTNPDGSPATRYPTEER